MTSGSRRAGAPRRDTPAPLLQDETLTDLAALDVVDLGLDGRHHLNRAFADEVEKEHRAEQRHRMALGYQQSQGYAPALRGAVRARVRLSGRDDLNAEALVHALLRLFPENWRA